MREVPSPEIYRLCERLHIDYGFFVRCVESGGVELEESEGYLDLDNGSVFRMRRLQRICETLEVDLTTALLILEMKERLARVERDMGRLRQNKP